MILRTVPNIIDIAKKSQYLAVLDIYGGKVYGGGVDRLLPQKIYTARKSVEWMQDLDGQIAEVRATATITVTSVPSDGANIAVTVDDPILGSIVLGSYTKVTGDSTTALLAQSIATALLANTYNYTIGATGSEIIITCPSGRGADINGGGRLTVSATVVGETAAIATLNTNSLTGISEGVEITMQVNDSSLGVITIGTYTTQAGDNVAATLAPRIAAAVTLQGYTAVASGDNMVVTARTGLGAAMNGLGLFLTWPVSGNVSTTFGGGVTGIGIIPNTLDQFSGGVDTSSGDADLQKVSNYLYWLCSKYALKSQGISGSGSVAPIVEPTDELPVYDFEVTTTSFIVAGQTVKSIPLFEGRQIQLFRGGIIQSTADVGGAYYDWDSVTATLTLINGEAQLGEVIQIYPV